MKKISLAVALILIISMLVGCSSASTSNPATAGSLDDEEKTTETTSAVIDNRTSNDASKEKQDVQQTVDFSDSDFDVKEYMYEDSWGTTMYFLVIKNNSNAVVEISANGIAKDGNGNMIGADDLEIDVLGPGEQSISYFYFDNVTGVSDVDYELNYSSDLNYDPVIADLDIQQTINNQNVVVSVTNNGDYPAEFVEAYALFFDANGNVISYNSTYLTDNDSEIKPGKTIVGQLNSYDAFDTVEVFLTGRHSNW